MLNKTNNDGQFYFQKKHERLVLCDYQPEQHFFSWNRNHGYQFSKLALTGCYYFSIHIVWLTFINFSLNTMSSEQCSLSAAQFKLSIIKTYFPGRGKLGNRSIVFNFLSFNLNWLLHQVLVYCTTKRWR